MWDSLAPSARPNLTELQYINSRGVVQKILECVRQTPLLWEANTEIDYRLAFGVVPYFTSSEIR